MTADFRMLLLFDTLKQRYTLNEIADKFGIHVGTVNRWVKLKAVPTHYFYDFNRLLGQDVSGENVTGNQAKDKDQYFTKPKAARHCIEVFCKVAKRLGVDLSDYTFIEPSVGYGDFYKELPSGRRIGIDIEPKKEILDYDKGIIKSDFLEWTPSKRGKYILGPGNPPFGLRGHLALLFINHAFEFADMVALILPPLFDSDGKGVPKKRVKGYVLAHSEKLPSGSFQYPDGREVDVNTIFQVWTKVNTDKVELKVRSTCEDYIRLYSLSDGGTPSSTRNKDMLDRCDVYLPSTCFDGMKAYTSFSELPNSRGYGVVILKDKTKIRSLLEKTDWTKVAFKSTNSALNLRASLIEDVVVTAGFADRK